MDKYERYAAAWRQNKLRNFTVVGTLVIFFALREFFYFLKLPNVWMTTLVVIFMLAFASALIWAISLRCPRCNHTLMNIWQRERFKAGLGLCTNCGLRIGALGDPDPDWEQKISTGKKLPGMR